MESSVRSVFGGAIITPAAPAAIASCVSARIAAKPGADTPTTTGTLARLMTRCTMSTDSLCSIFGASPSWPSTVIPLTPAFRKKSVMRSIEDSSIRPSGWNGVGAITYTPCALLSSFMFLEESCGQRALETPMNADERRCFAEGHYHDAGLTPEPIRNQTRAHVRHRRSSAFIGVFHALVFS